jgi:hypothetical protein
MAHQILSEKITNIINALKEPDEDSESFIERLLRDYYEKDPINGIFNPSPFKTF